MSTTTIHISRNYLLDCGFDDEPGVTDQNKFMVDVIKADLADAGIESATVHMNSAEMQIGLDNAELAEAVAALKNYLG